MVNNTVLPQTATNTVSALPQTTARSAESLQKPAEESSRTDAVKVAAPVAALNIVPAASAMPAETPTESSKSVVNTRAQDNEAAGGVSLAAMARQPAGFNAYTITMPDVSFYTPREIYRNQRVVDNARAQRLLNGASDQLHQQMIEQQYKK